MSNFKYLPKSGPEKEYIVAMYSKDPYVATDTDKLLVDGKEYDISEVTKEKIGLGNVTNDAQVKRSEMGQASGVATLNASGKVPAELLPSYVDDILEFPDVASFPATGESGKIYVSISTGYTYRWSGTTYIPTTEPISADENQGLVRKSDGLYVSKHAKDMVSSRGALDNVISTLVEGPNTATNGAVVLFDGTNGKAVKNSATVGSNNLPIYLNNGVPTVVTQVPKTLILTKAEYDALSTKDPNTFYITE